MGNTSVIIVTYNGMKWIKRCIESVLDNSIVSKIIIVDNSSTDKTTIFIKENFPEVILLEQTKNLGFGAANNIGISYALNQGADYVFLLNQDAYLKQGLLKKLVEVQKDFPAYGILSPIHLDGKGERLDEHFSNYVNYQNCKDFYSDFVLSKKVKTVYEVPMVNAAGWLLSGSILKTVGGFDPIFFHYGEDDNYCQRARFHGFKIGVVTQTYLRHDKEPRVSIKTGWRTPEYYRRMEREFKIKYADINEENYSELYTLRMSLQKKYNRSVFKLQFRKAQVYMKEIVLLSRLIIEIKDSRTRNKNQNPNYLD